MTAERPLLGGLLYGVNTQGGLNPCFDEAMETIMTCHYSGVLMTNVASFENHAQDSRVKLLRDDVCPTVGASNPASAEFSPIVLVRPSAAKGGAR